MVALAGLIAGLASGLFGVGGGVVMVPAVLFLVPGTDFHLAKAASLVVIAVSSTWGILTHQRKRSVDLTDGALLAGGGLVGTALAAWAVEGIAAASLTLAFAAVLLAAGLRLALGGSPRAHVISPGRRRAYLIAGGFAGGLLAGAFGIGGGILMVPLLLFVGVPIHMAVGTSLVAVLVNAVSGTITHAALGYGPQLLSLGVPLAIGAVPGTRLGALWAHKLHADRLRRAFGVFLALVAVSLALRAF